MAECYKNPKNAYKGTGSGDGGMDRREICTEALYCCVYGLGWPLAISWRLGFSGKGFHILNIVELRARSHFSKRQLLESHLHIADYGVASFEGF